VRHEENHSRDWRNRQDRKEYVAALEQVPLEPEFISLITYLFTEVLDGRNESVSDGVTRALGRPARVFADYAREAAAAGAWQ
jgi:hypothetical protein